MASSSINPLTPVSKTANVLKRRKKSRKPTDDTALKPKTDEDTEGTTPQDLPQESVKKPHIDTYA